MPKDYSEQTNVFVEEWGLFLNHHCGSKDCSHYGHYLEAKAALTALLHDVEKEARIDELKNLNWAEMTWRDDMADFVLYSSDLHELRDDHIKQLQEQRRVNHE